MIRSFVIFGLLCSIVFGQPSITLTPISTFFNTPVMVAYDVLTDSLVASVNYPCGYCPCPGVSASACAGVTTGTFERILFNGARVPFSNINTLTDEVHIATVKVPNPAGFSQGDLFTGNGVPGQVVRISGAGTVVTNPWVSLPSNYLLRGHLLIDEVGIFGYNLIVSTNGGEVFIVNSTGGIKYLATTGIWCEGLEVVPANSSRYGPMAGSVLTVSEYSNSVYAIYPDGTVKSWPTPGCSGDNVNMVHSGDNFFGVNFGSSNILGVQNSEIQSLAGELVVTCEYWSVGSSGMFHLFWDGTNVQVQSLLLTPSSFKPAQWEHVTFVNTGLLQILPSNFNFCYWVDLFGVNTRFGSVHTSQLAPVEYSWSITYPGTHSFVADSYNGQNVTALAATVQIYFYQDSLNNFYLTFLIDKVNSGNAGTLDVALSVTGVSPSGMSIVVQDDPKTIGTTATDFGDFFSFNAATGQGRFTWQWGASTTDGLVLGTIPVVGAFTPNFCFKAQILSSTGISTVQFIDSKPSTSPPINPATNPIFNFCRISCTCGNGIVEQGEQCDGGTCCNPDCTFVTSGTVCASNTSNICAGVATCSGTSSVCPPIPVAPLCNCTYPKYGPGCIYVNCGTASNCSQCQAIDPACGWCCNSANPNGGTCLQQNIGSGGCSTKFAPAGVCTCVGGCQNGGTCNCGSCTCIPPYAGPNCQYLIDCFNHTVPVGQPVAVVDVCGVCGGNGTTCIGCNGVPNGPKTDICGVCGGTGNECVNKCPYADCNDCRTAENCAWCPSSSTCIVQTAAGTCAGGVATVCTALSTAALVATSIGGGVIAAIVIAVVVAAALAAFGGKKGYDVWMKHRNNMTGAQSNPMYTDSGNNGNNPLYESQ